MADAPVLAAALGSWHTERPDEDRFPLELIARRAFADFERKPKANHWSTVEVIARTDLSRSFCPLLLNTLHQKSPDRDIQAAAIISALVYNRDYFDEAPEKLLSTQLNPRYSQARRKIAVAALGILAQRSPSAIRAMASTGRSLQSTGPDKIGEQLMYDAAMLARRNFPGQNILARPNSDDSD